MAVVEHALLRIDPHRHDAFAAAFAAAEHLLATSNGARSVELHRSIDDDGVYLLRVVWDRIEDHLVDFPASDAGRRFASEVGPFFVSEPIVAHFPA